MHFVLGEFEFSVANIFIGEEFYFLEADNLRAHQDVTVRMRMRARLGSGGVFEDADLRVADGVRVIVDVDALHVSFAFLEIKVLDVVLLAAVNVDGFFVKENQGAGKIHFANNGRRAGDIDNHEIIAGHGPQADRVGGISFLRPVIIFSGQMQEAGFGESRTQIR